MAPALAKGELTRDLRLRVGLHRGPAMVATLNDHLDYFGTMVNAVTQLPRLVAGGQVALSNAIATDPQVVSLLQTRGLQSELIDATLPGTDPLVHRVKEKG